MVGKLIEIESGKIVIKPVCHHIKPLKDIMDFYPYDNGKVVHFLHCMVSLNPLDNPFADLPEQEKEEKITRYLNINVDIDNSIVKDALECVLSTYSTPIFRSYRSLKTLRDKINFELENTEVDFSKEGNSANITNMVKSLSTFNKELKEAKKDYMEEQGEVRGRGGFEMSYDENDEDLDDEEDYEEDED